MDIEQVPLLTRREIEARILAPFVEDLAAVFGREAVLEVLRGTIQRLARQQGAALAQRLGRNDLTALEEVVNWWRGDDALRLEVEARDARTFAFCVTRCAYAEMYRDLGLAPELGAILSCSRDAAFIEGFNPRLRFRRTHTLMEGASGCDFHYTLEEQEDAP